MLRPWLQTFMSARAVERIEVERGPLYPSDIPPLIDLYFQVDDWRQKIALVQIVHDQRDQALEAIMLDVLRAPPDPTWFSVWVDRTKTLALNFLVLDSDFAARAFADRTNQQAAMDAFLAERGIQVAYDEVYSPPPPPEPPSPELPPWERLYVACQRGDLPTVLALLEAGHDLDSQMPIRERSAESTTPLEVAILHEEIDLALALLARGASPCVASHPSEATPLIAAALIGSLCLTEALLERGADPNQVDRYGEGPLHASTRAGASHVTKRLLEAGARVDAPISDGTTPLWRATYGHVTEAVALLLDAGAPIDALIAGETALHVAAGQGHLEIVSLLLERGANANLYDEEGLTPLMRAAWRSSPPQIVCALLDAGADPNAPAGPGKHTGRRAVDFVGGARADELRALLEGADPG